MPETLAHLLRNVVPAAAEYEAAEQALSAALHQRDGDISQCSTESALVLRKAGEVAIAIDGMTERAHNELGLPKKAIRAQVDLLAVLHGELRTGAAERIRGVAVAYRHAAVSDTSLPITSPGDVLVVGSGYGIDAYGVGKMGTPEVLVNPKDGSTWKFLGDVPAAVRAWVSFLESQGETVSPLTICGVQIP